MVPLDGWARIDSRFLPNYNDAILYGYPDKLIIVTPPLLVNMLPHYIS